MGDVEAILGSCISLNCSVDKDYSRHQAICFTTIHNKYAMFETVQHCMLMSGPVRRGSCDETFANSSKFGIYTHTYYIHTYST